MQWKASVATVSGYEYTFSDRCKPFLDLLIRISNISSLGTSEIDCGVGYSLKIARELFDVIVEKKYHNPERITLKSADNFFLNTEQVLVSL
ncbi:hypothetical protein [Clostridium botulinum]|uniref:hypothetical protein n=1 Tax=Clostridium botulinum TaxID=1491 RepID=UPI00077434DA|nr:hypothetical protein [Clostridium botulinum]